jgi:hypothetical protein
MRTRHETWDGEDAVEVQTDETPAYTTYTRGTSEPLYVGDNFTEAAHSLGMGEQEFQDLLMSDDLL